MTALDLVVLSRIYLDGCQTVGEGAFFLLTHATEWFRLVLMTTMTRKELAHRVACMLRAIESEPTDHNISAVLSEISQWADGPTPRAEQRLYNAPVGAFARFCRMVRKDPVSR